MCVPGVCAKPVTIISASLNMQKANDKAAVDRIFKDLDANSDNCVDFGEFVTLVCALTQMCHEFFTSKK